VAAWLAAEEAVTISTKLTRPAEAVEVKVATLLSLEEQRQRFAARSLSARRLSPSRRSRFACQQAGM